MFDRLVASIASHLNCADCPTNAESTKETGKVLHSLGSALVKTTNTELAELREDGFRQPDWSKLLKWMEGNIFLR